MAERPGGTGRVAIAFLISVAASAAFIFVYQVDGGTQWLAVALACAFGALGAGLAWWSRRLMPQGPDEEARPTLVPPAEEQQRTAATFQESRQAIRRRGLLGGLLATAAGALGLGAVWPGLSLGPAPARALRASGWRDGIHLVDDGGERVPADALDYGSVLTVFPEGREAGADDQVILLRVPVGNLSLPRERRDWTPDGYIAFSKVCTHAGCPVGLYQNVGQLLLCPCHQATFDVAQAARPVFGPAPRELPQLPLRIADGLLVAGGEFSGPVGPDRWSIDKGDV